MRLIPVEMDECPDSEFKDGRHRWGSSMWKRDRSWWPGHGDVGIVSCERCKVLGFRTNKGVALFRLETP